MSRKKVKNEVVAIVAEGIITRMITDRELFALYEAFHRQLQVYRGPEDRLTIYSVHEQYQNRLLALLPLMPAFEQRRVIIDTQRMIKLRLHDELDKLVP
jgi:hypothetical protein